MTTFNGFQSPNFTQIPNEYLDYTFSPESDLSKVQMQIMNFVFRETFGWQDKHKILVFSATDIMALLNIRKRNTVTNALNGLVEDKKFLESMEVSNLPKKVRSNIEKSLKRTLQPKQKIYRLNLVDGKKRSWDNIEEPHTDIIERKTSFKSGNQMVTSNEKVITSGNQMVTSSNNQKVTTLGVETIDTVETDQPLNKDLNKLVNKISSSRDSINNELKNKYCNVPFEVVKEELLNDPTATINTIKQYKSMLEYRLKNWKHKPTKLTKYYKKPIRSEMLPDWFDEENKTVEEPKKEELPPINELLKQIRSV